MLQPIKKRFPLFSLVILQFIAQVSFAQGPDLLPFIGLDQLPSDEDTVCYQEMMQYAPIQDYSFEWAGPDVGDTVPDFTLYTLDGTPMNMKEELGKGKPVLLIGGSYTCIKFRFRVPVMNDVDSLFEDEIQTYVVYTPEAHPQDTSPYSGTIWPDNNIVYYQPTTYGEKKDIVEDMLDSMEILPEILLDGPCNEWWHYFGPAPTISYLINTDGTIFAKHEWFHIYPSDIYSDIDSLLEIVGGDDPQGDTTSAFSFHLLEDSVGHDVVGSTILIDGMLVNQTTQPVELEIKRVADVSNPGWSSAMCTSICLPDYIDSTSVLIAPLDSQAYTMYIYTAAYAGMDSVTIQFMNVQDSSNMVLQRFYGVAEEATGRSEVAEGIPLHFQLYPNPTNGLLIIRNTASSALELRVHSILGKEVGSFWVGAGQQLEWNIGNWPNGMYPYSVYRNGVLIHADKIITSR